MTSELSVVTAEIVDILPRKERTLANQEWIEAQLKTNSIQDVLDAIQQHFDVSNNKIASCEKRLEKLDLKLDQHVAYTDQRFAAVDVRVSQLERDLAVTKAVNDERASTQQFLAGQIMQSINSTNQSVANVATKSSKSVFVYPDPVLWGLGVVTLFFIFMSVKVQFDKPQAQPQPQTQPRTATFWDCTNPSQNPDGTTKFATCSRNTRSETY